MTTPVSDEQISFREDLLAKAIDKSSSTIINQQRLSVGFRANRNEVATLALLCGLPVPVDDSDASAQIDALKDSDIFGYAREHQEWAQLVLGRVAEVFGDNVERFPTIHRERGDTAAQINAAETVKVVSAVRGALGAEAVS